MNNSSTNILLFALISSTFLLLSCDQTSSLENTPPHIESQPFQQPSFYTESEDTIRFSDNRFIVIFQDQADRVINEQTAQEAVELTQLIFADYNIPQDSLIHQYKYATKGFAVKMNEEQAEILRNDSRIRHVVNDFSYKAIQEITPKNAPKAIENSISSTVPWGVERVGGPLNGTGKRAWVLDTGIQLDHPELNVDFGNSVSFVANETASDYHGHGTRVAGVIGASDNSSNVVGVAADAYVVAVKVCNQSGQCYVSDVKGGVDYVAGNYSSGEVANISLSWPIGGNSFVDIPLSELENAIITAADDGLMFTIAAGNQGIHADNRSPARIVNNNVWTMSAMDQNDVFASFSNFGNPPIEYANPGVDIFSTTINNGTATRSGTSYSAPHVAGLLLLMPNNIRIDGYVTNDPDGNPDPIAAAATQLSAPFIFASVNNDHPHLGWGAVNNAESYRIYRRIEQGSWTFIGTVSTTSFTDWTQSSPNLSVISSPHSNWDNTLGYRVKSSSSQSGYDDSPFSNTVYFSTDGSCNPCQ